MQAKNSELQTQIDELTETNLKFMTTINSYQTQRRATLVKEKEQLTSQDAAAVADAPARSQEEIDAELE